MVVAIVVAVLLIGRGDEAPTSSGSPQTDPSWASLLASNLAMRVEAEAIIAADSDFMAENIDSDDCAALASFSDDFNSALIRIDDHRRGSSRLVNRLAVDFDIYGGQVLDPDPSLSEQLNEISQQREEYDTQLSSIEARYQRHVGHCQLISGDALGLPPSYPEGLEAKSQVMQIEAGTIIDNHAYLGLDSDNPDCDTISRIGDDFNRLVAQVDTYRDVVSPVVAGALDISATLGTGTVDEEGPELLDSVRFQHQVYDDQIAAIDTSYQFLSGNCQDDGSDQKDSHGLDS